MSKIWRWIAPAAAVGTVVAGAVASTGIPAQAATQASYHVTIGARGTAFGSVKGKVAGRALVAYKAAGHDRGTISGAVTGNQAGDVVSLLAKPFRAATFKATGQQVTLTAAGSASYSFAVQPSLATGYRVQVSTTTGSTTTVDATSAVATLYVEASGHGFKAHQKCTSTTCRYWYTASTVLPASAYKTESRKHVYMYLAQWYSAKHPARWFYLSRTATTSKVKRINSGEFELTYTWHVHLRTGQNYWLPLSCTKDSVAKDGLGLPGGHGCGAKRVSAKVTYLG
jgi:hypothetical protein